MNEQKNKIKDYQSLKVIKMEMKMNIKNKQE